MEVTRSKGSHSFSMSSNDASVLTESVSEFDMSDSKRLDNLYFSRAEDGGVQAAAGGPGGDSG